jgi:hypothetical protein
MREKLIELIEEAYYCSIEELADHLIANGVVISNSETTTKWIPVTERLPKDDSNVLACLRIGEEGRIYPANYAKGVWWDCIFNTPATKTTTHWMPLPEPPKGE